MGPKSTRETLPKSAKRRKRSSLSRFWHRVRHSDSARVRALAARTPYLFVFTALFVVVALHILIDPFGFSRLTQRYAQDVTNLPLTGLIYPHIGQATVAVARVDDSTLSKL